MLVGWFEMVAFGFQSLACRDPRPEQVYLYLLLAELESSGYILVGKSFIITQQQYGTLHLRQPGQHLVYDIPGFHASKRGILRPFFELFFVAGGGLCTAIEINQAVMGQREQVRPDGFSQYLFPLIPQTEESILHDIFSHGRIPGETQGIAVHVIR